ncbi:hypothetical protein N800_10215 [Lysobacter daejeonensis GH1-9]|uniref:Phasin domain-containing protein n=1 Tax=Lysobacter daejeonensis GH1-9 TaxID=1385517 RepID=A0A0A0EYG3_9GAMM|nr:hypothetical protein [Lysobacter daejeonensis]KGM55991.1 hypothetical protein N800_10215 [Lysobacter daejeonensis GH1-9]
MTKENEKRDPGVLQMKDDGRPEPDQVADAIMQGVTHSAVTAHVFASPSWAGLDLTSCVHSLRDQVKAVNGGDLAGLESMLLGQAVALSAMFNACVQRAATAMGTHPKLMEQYMRLGLKAQSQCRTTLETIAEIKNPRPVAFVKQANIANGHQQVNNGVATDRDHARGEENPFAPNKLLEGGNVARLDTRTTRASGGDDSTLETVGTRDRAANGRG